MQICNHEKTKINYEFIKNTKHFWEVIKVKTCKDCKGMRKEYIGVTDDRKDFLKNHAKKCSNL